MANDIHHPAEKRARANAYREASLQHLARLNRCHNEGTDPALEIYLAGLSFECMLRAYRQLIDPEFDARHSLADLAKQAQFAAVVSPGQAAVEYAERLGRMAVAWRSNDRFATSTALAKRLRMLGYTPASETLAHVAGLLYEDAQWLVGLGRERWR